MNVDGQQQPQGNPADVPLPAELTPEQMMMQMAQQFLQAQEQTKGWCQAMVENMTRPKPIHVAVPALEGFNGDASKAESFITNVKFQFGINAHEFPHKRLDLERPREGVFGADAEQFAELLQREQTGGGVGGPLDVVEHRLEAVREAHHVRPQMPVVAKDR